MIQDKPLVLGIGGTPRRGSSSERALVISLKAAEDEGARTLLLSGAELLLPMYMPGQQQSDQASRLLAAFRECHGIIISSPAYHGSISGLIKNALDYADSYRARRWALRHAGRPRLCRGDRRFPRGAKVICPPARFHMRNGMLRMDRAIHRYSFK